MKLPEGWKEVELKELIEDMHQGINTVTENIEYQNEGYRIIQSKHITGGKLDLSDARFVKKEDYKKYKDKYNPKKGDLLLCNIGTIGKNIIVENDAEFLIAWNLFLIKINKDKVIPEFLKIYFDKLENAKFFDRFLTGGTVKFINKTKIGDIKIPIPPLPTQQKIVSILEKADKAKEWRKETDELTDNYLKSVFLEMFGDPGKNPKKWPKSNLLNVSREKPKYGSGASAVDYDDKLRYVRITDIEENGELRDDLVSPSNFEEEYLLEKGDLLFARSGATVGKTYLHKENKKNAIYAGYMIRFRFKTHLCNPIFIYHLTKSDYYWSWIKKNQTQVAQPNINARQYGEFEIFLPPIYLQSQFARIVEQTEKLKQYQHQSKEQIDNLFNALMQKAFKGELEI